MSGMFEGLSEDRKGFFALVLAERSAQDAKWGYPQENTFVEWGSYLAEESGEATKELNNLFFGNGNTEHLITELVQVAAVCLSIIEHIDVAGDIRIVRERISADTIFDEDNQYEGVRPMKEIAYAATNPPSGWIPCNGPSILPLSSQRKEDGDWVSYLVTTMDHRGGWRVIKAYFEDNKWISCVECCAIYSNDEVVAWRPFPNRYIANKEGVFE